MLFLDKIRWRIKDCSFVNKLIKGGKQQLPLNVKDRKTKNTKSFFPAQTCSQEKNHLPFHVFSFSEGIIQIKKESTFDESEVTNIFGKRFFTIKQCRLITIHENQCFFLEQDSVSLVFKKLIAFNLESGETESILIEGDWRVTLSAFVSFDKKLLIINRLLCESIEVLYYDLQSKALHSLSFATDNPQKSKEYLQKSKENGTFFYADHAQNHFVICSNMNSEKERIFSKSDNSAEWKLIYDTKCHEELLECNVIGKERELGVLLYNDLLKRNECIILNKAGKELVRITLQSMISAVDVSLQGRNIVRIVESNISGTETIHFNLQNTTKIQKSMPQREKEYNSEIKIETHFTKSDIPITIIKNNQYGKSQEILFHVYGSYGENSFDNDASWIREALQRGVIIAVGHVRGGREKGWKWYAEGRGRKKQNTINDALQCVEYLKREFKKEQIAMYGFSAGGWIAVNCLRHNPQDYSCIILDRALLDLQEYQKEYRNIALSNVDEEEFALNEVAYSGFDMKRTKKMPHVLVAAMKNDRRIPFKMTFDWFLKYKRLNRNVHILIDKESGHNFLTETQSNLYYFKILSFLLNPLKKEQ